MRSCPIGSNQECIEWVVRPIFDLLAEELQYARQARQGPPGGASAAEAVAEDDLLQLQRSLRATTMNFTCLLTTVARRCRPQIRDGLLQLLDTLRESS